MHLLMLVALLTSFFAMVYSSSEFINNRHKVMNCEDVILISIVMLSLLNICICTLFVGWDITLTRLVACLVFGSILNQSILSLFTVNYIINKKD